LTLQKAERNISLSLSHSERLSTRGAIQAVMECLTETAICSPLAGRDLFGQRAQPSPPQTAAFLRRRGTEQRRPSPRALAPIRLGLQNKHLFVPSCNSTGFIKKKKRKAVSLHSALGLEPKKYSKAEKQGGNTMELY